MPHFGARFGRLVKAKRQWMGLKATELALEALGDKAKRSRISEIENGRVANPNAATVGALISHLAISEEEIAECRNPMRNVGDRATDLGVPRELLENLAQRFGVENPDAPEAELIAFLKETATEWKDLKARLAALEALDDRLKNYTGAAEAAMASGNFAEADKLLAMAEEMQQEERTLREVRKQADIRATRAMAALLAGDAESAAGHFEAAAGFFAGMSPGEGARRRNKAAITLAKRGLAFGGKFTEMAVALWEANFEVYTRENAPQDWAMTQNNLAVAL